MIDVDRDQRLSGILTMDGLVMHPGDALADRAEALRSELAS